MRKIEHIGIAVDQLSVSVPLFEKLLNTACYKQEVVESEQVTTAFFKKGETKIELLESTSPEGIIAKYIGKKGEGIHHIAFDVKNSQDTLQTLASEGFQAINDKPKPGADNKMIAFLHPKSTNGVLVEICNEIGS